ncbi:N-formylglutamate amidohydrolase [Aliiroseovarius subalbicans]|uniref:N-formylglutamate amidohydrolase n=1 Tax=Aliiroseovarius subalbicans TaxID=2925840 RepID=UPI001F5A234D|nr:N-formylglutamate amidohydrolase [Aliiroseovarius subalbicans]MCI2399815.1 N-formylglutamate amidohydrolase [Aliiroseovarius subalbicans]
MPKTPYTLTMPSTRTTSVVFASPHSGRDYPWSFTRRSVLDECAIRSSEDAFVDRLYAAAPDYGAPFLAANAPRAFVDMNRAAEDLDPALIKGLRKTGQNPRVASGLGVIPRVVAGGREIYRGKLTLGEAQGRLTDHWHPYHRKLQELLDGSLALFGEAILIDCHSMPHEAIDNLCRNQRRKPEVVLGDRFGSSASAEIVDRIEAAFAAAGFSVARNAPFAGAYMVQHYGRPSRGQHVVQIEIDRSLYMNERKIRPNGNFSHLQAILTEIISEVADIGRSKLPLAAE